ncbi:hypothetical protein GPECTOR_550g563 [Gonium pectorale]|uniref:Ankyrin repeat domain-containing protein n=1 Tax=Gonium pectorale TaxID=33097 RepID=A0A150FUM7_GONPE|nr:hypothetical protein GPECTOR_550g563 [Gonium pectorale]|eukprot:KXZ41324.1 hypothetical protein GPECTOR_550g563 [Gonium pectorale]
MQAAAPTPASDPAPDIEPEASRIWLPDILELIASFLPPADVAFGLMLVNRAAGALFRGRPQYTTVRLARPVAPWAFAARWGAPGAMQPLSLDQRRRLLHLTAASGVIPNLKLATGAVGFLLCPEEKARIMQAAVAAGSLGACRWLRKHGYPVPRAAAVAACRQGQGQGPEALEFVLENGVQWDWELVCAAVKTGRMDLAEWLLARRSDGPLRLDCGSAGSGSGGGGVSDSNAGGPGGTRGLAAAALGDAMCWQLLAAAAEGCDLPALQSLWCGLRSGGGGGADGGIAGGGGGGTVAAASLSQAIQAAAGSPTPDWREKTDGSPHWAAAFRHDLATLRCLRRLGCPWGPPGALFDRCVGWGLPLPLLRWLAEEGGCPVRWESAGALATSNGTCCGPEVQTWLVARMWQDD